MDYRQYCRTLIKSIPAVLLERMMLNNHSGISHLETQILHTTPNIWLIRNFLSNDECLHLQDISKEHLQPSKVLDNDTGLPTIKAYRTSRHLFLPLHADTIITRIEARIAALLQIPFEYGDGLQILNYQPGQEYRPHHDYFYAHLSSGQNALNTSGQRVLTLLMYLNTVLSGGETVFPEINLSIKPEKGSVLIFGNLKMDGSPEPKTLHASLPVLAGEKWVATKWIHEQSYLYSLGLIKAHESA